MIWEALDLWMPRGIFLLQTACWIVLLIIALQLRYIIRQKNSSLPKICAHCRAPLPQNPARAVCSPQQTQYVYVCPRCRRESTFTE